MNLEGEGSSTHIKKKIIVNLYLFLVWGEPWFESHSFTYNNWISKKCRNCQFIWPYLSHLLHVLNFWNIWTKYLIFKISKQRGGISIFLKKPKQGEGVTIPPFLSSPSLVTLYSLLLPNIQTYCKIGSFFFLCHPCDSKLCASESKCVSKWVGKSALDWYACKVILLKDGVCCSKPTSRVCFTQNLSVNVLS